MKVLNVIISIVSYVLIMGSFFYSFKLAKDEHNVDLKEVKNEVSHGYFIRAILSIIYYFCFIDWIIDFGFMNWAYIPNNLIVNIIGATLMMLVTALFWWISISLGSNYHGPLKLHGNHKLVKTGPYKFSRHPTYLAFPLFHISLFLVTSNYIILCSGLIMSIYTNHHRIKVEEKLLTEKLGKEYENYMKRTGKYFSIPRRI